MATFIIVLMCICCFLFGLLFGVGVTDSTYPVVGRFVMNTQPGREHLFEIEFTKDLDTFSGKRYVTFEMQKR